MLPVRSPSHHPTMSNYNVAFNLQNAARDLPVLAARAHSYAIELEADLRANWSAKSVLDSATKLRDAVVEALEPFGPAANSPTVKHLRDALMVTNAVIQVAGPAAAADEAQDADEAAKDETPEPIAGAEVFAFPPATGTADLAATV